MLEQQQSALYRGLSRVGAPHASRRLRTGHHEVPDERGVVGFAASGFGHRVRLPVGHLGLSTEEGHLRPNGARVPHRAHLLVERGVQGGVPDAVPVPLPPLVVLPQPGTLLQRLLFDHVDGIHLGAAGAPHRGRGRRVQPGRRHHDAPRRHPPPVQQGRAQRGRARGGSPAALLPLASSPMKTKGA